MMPVSQSGPIPSQQGLPPPPPQPPRPPSPKFVSVDLPPAKLAHSDVYLKYDSVNINTLASRNQ